MGARGRFITLEGGEGAGKSTQIRHLARFLQDQGRQVVLTREPGGSPGAEILRNLVLHGGHDWAPQAEILLHFAIRAEHIARTIRPALDRGDWVLCDRYYDSTMVYQGDGQGGDRANIAQLSAMMGLVPDLTLVLEVPVATSLARLTTRGQGADRYERLGAPFFETVRLGFRRIVADNPGRCVLVPADMAEAALADQLAGILRDRLPA